MKIVVIKTYIKIGMVMDDTPAKQGASRRHSSAMAPLAERPAEGAA